jgi:diacylglycerol kinase family enzyme
MSTPTLPATRAVTELTGSEALFIVLNAGSGKDDANATRDLIASLLTAAGRRFEIDLVEDPHHLPEAARRATDRAVRERGVVVAAGGDGTLNAVTQAVIGRGVAFAILPQGTFNYFGRTFGIPSDTTRAVAALLDARVEPVQIGMVNEHAFLVNASMGLYPTLLEDREAWKKRYGRSRVVAFWSSLVTLMRRPPQWDLDLDLHGKREVLRTPTLVVGNNALQLEQIGIAHVDKLERGQLVAMSVRPVSTFTLYWLLLRGAFSRLGNAEDVISFGFDRLEVRPHGRRRHIKVAMDGEIVRMSTPLVFKVSENPLPLLVPRNVDPADRA